jgi:hypothetical protein
MLRLFKIVKIEYRGLINNSILNIKDSIRSCITYLGVKKIKDIPKCAIFVRVNHKLNQIKFIMKNKKKKKYKYYIYETSN